NRADDQIFLAATNEQVRQQAEAGQLQVHPKIVGIAQPEHDGSDETHPAGGITPTHAPAAADQPRAENRKWQRVGEGEQQVAQPAIESVVQTGEQQGSCEGPYSRISQETTAEIEGNHRGQWRKQHSEIGGLEEPKTFCDQAK